MFVSDFWCFKITRLNHFPLCCLIFVINFHGIHCIYVSILVFTLWKSDRTIFPNIFSMNMPWSLHKLPIARQKSKLYIQCIHIWHLMFRNVIKQKVNLNLYKLNYSKRTNVIHDCVNLWNILTVVLLNINRY